MTFHEIILEKLLEYRESNPRFNFLMRQRNGSSKRFESGHWFQGNDDYAFVGLINASGGSNRTRSVGISISPNSQGFSTYLEIVYNEEKDEKLIQCYQSLAKSFKEISSLGDTKYSLYIGNITHDDFSKLFSFLDENYESIILIFKKNNCQHVLVKDEKFNTLLEKLNKYRLSDDLVKTNSNNLSNIEARVIYAYLKKALSHRGIQRDILGEEAPARGGGFMTMQILHKYEIRRDKKGVLARKLFNEEYQNATGKYLEALKLLKHFYPEFSIDNLNNSKMDLQLNSIIYGPPGTGKTFKLKNEYFAKFSIKESSLSKEQFILNQVTDLTWWQTFAIALFQMGTTSVDQLLEHEVVKAKTSLSKAKNIRPIAWSRMQAHSVSDCPNVNVSDTSEPPLFYKEKDSQWRVVKENMQQLYPEGIEILERINNFNPSQDTIVKNYEFVTFHQSYSYEDFVEGIKPKLEDENTKLEYEISDGIFKKLCRRAEKDLENNYAIFIDEINRGNVSAIFGELITLIEKDKRLGSEQEIKVKLPYSKKEFSVPPNLYIIGTMNTADRSVEALDTALRRRFVFEEVMPNPSLLSDIEFNGFNLGEVLETINNRIEALLDRDHTIGHSYFINLENGNVAGLENTFKNNIIPLLQEYFYNDYQKIALVLGPGFVDETNAKEITFPSFKSIDSPEVIPAFQLRKEIDIETAINQLLLKQNAQV